MKKFPVFSLVITAAITFCLAAAVTAAEDVDYRLGTGDVLRIAVYDHPDLSTVARIDSDGNILFPLAGKLQVGGLTTVRAAEAISNKLDQIYVVNPQVSVFVEEFRSKKVVVMGEVIRPGLYELSGPTNLIELISKAGGLTPGAGQTATIRRTGGADGQGTLLTVNIKQILESGAGDKSLQLMDGDTLTVAKAGVVYVTGQVRRPAAYALDPETTVIKAVTMAGGFTELAAQSKIKIIRKVDGREKVLEKVTLHEKLMANDVMVVPESFF